MYCVYHSAHFYHIQGACTSWMCDHITGAIGGSHRDPRP
jgi:hypothetical protein